MLSTFRRTVSIVTLSIFATSLSWTAIAHERDDDSNHDPVVLRFSTVGDSRQDPVTFDPTAAPLSGQDKIWLQNTKAWTQIIRSVEEQESKLLFFNGDMIMGYGLAGPAKSGAVADVLSSDLMAF